MTSERLATSIGDVSHYRVDLGRAHTILAQVCISVLLHDHVEENGVGTSSPLAEYAALYWGTHAQHFLHLRERRVPVLSLLSPHPCASPS